MQAKADFDAVPAAARENAATTVYYDGACPVCSREIAAYRRLAGAAQCAWVDASSCPESAFGAGLSRKAALARFHVRRVDGVLVDGTRGFAALWCVLPRMAWAGRIASFRPVAALLDLAYGVFLRVRPLWQRAPATSALKELS
jgi:predicted DCC family thiol-disulfide oxidoreductase YuxK